MIARYRRNRKIYFIILVVAISVLSIGFASFSRELNINSTAIVKPDYGDFRVVFSSNGESFVENGDVTVKVVGDATGSSPSIENEQAIPTISNLVANFTGPGESVTYEFYAYNIGAYVAYLTNVEFNNVSKNGSNKVCTAIDSSVSVVEACNNITVKIMVGDDEFFGSTSEIVGHSLDISAFEMVKVVITYGGDVSTDGDFSVEFGDIQLTYSSAFTGM